MSRTYHFQREGAASDASRKRKNRGRKEGDVVKGEKKRIRKVTSSKAAVAYAWLVGRWQKDLISGGTNNATSLAALVSRFRLALCSLTWARAAGYRASTRRCAMGAASWA